jgi:hypothetical protein
VPAPRPSDGELLSSMGIDLDTVRHETEQTFGFQAVGEATWRVTRRRGWRGARVVWTPLCGPPFVAKRAVQLASEHTQAFGHGGVTAEHLLLTRLGADDERALRYATAPTAPAPRRARSR